MSVLQLELAVIEVDPSVVGELGNRKRTRAGHSSREHLGFGTALICFAANINCSAA